MENLSIYKNDPIDSYEEVKEVTAADNYYQTDISTIPETAQIYVAEMEREIKTLNQTIHNLKFPKTTLDADDLRLLTQPRLNG